MSGPTLPAVRLPAILSPQSGDSDDLGSDAVVVELPSSSKFGFAWPEAGAEGSPLPPPPITERVLLDSSESDTDASDAVQSDYSERHYLSGQEENEHTPTSRLQMDENPLEAREAQPPSVPRLSRAFSMPVASQLGHLKNPRRMPSSSGSSAGPESPLPRQAADNASFHELSLELADSVQMVIQTLLQLSPPQVLDPAKEQFSACSLSIPTPSISAMFTSMKNLNYMSANMFAFTSGLPSPPLQPGDMLSGFQSAVPHTDFDIGEMLQSVGDALSGMAAEAGVDLVLYHGDVGMKHVSVKGDECGISYTISHILRQVIDTAKSGDSVEIGLFTADLPGSSSEDEAGRLRCSIEISHKYASDPTPRATLDSPPPSPVQMRPEPNFHSAVLRRLLRLLDAVFLPDQQPKLFPIGRACEIEFTLQRGDPAAVNPSIISSPSESLYPSIHISSEPTLEELSQFAETLKGKKVTLYASSKGSFAHHLTSYLTAWGMDVNHVSTETGDGTVDDQSEAGLPRIPELTAAEALAGRGLFGPGSTIPSLLSPHDGSPGQDAASLPPPVSSAFPRYQLPISFIFIDDDVEVLRERLKKMRVDSSYPLHLNSRKRPSLAANHRPRSSPLVARSLGLPVQPPGSITPEVIVHFTSLSNFKLVKEVIQAIFQPTNGAPIRVPEVIVIPKPAGPRRFLTALHTAVTKPVVDPYFMPIATSPLSPGISSSPFFNFTANARTPESPPNRPASTARTSSDRTDRSERGQRSPKEMPLDSPIVAAPPSPLAMSEGMEYFAEAAQKLGTSPSQGLVIQSPDGQPAAIFFHPRPKNGKAGTPSGAPMEREKGPLILPGHRSSSRRASGERVRSDTPSSPQSSATQRSPLPPLTLPLTPEGLGDPGPSTAAGRTKVWRASSGSPWSEGPPASLQAIVSAGVQVISPDTVSVPRPSRRTSAVDRRGSTPPMSPRADGTPATPVPRTRRRASRPTPTGSAAATPPARATASATGDGKVVPPISVLIVDDNPINQTILSVFMKRKKIKYDVAKNGEEAVQKWKSGGFHLILMDIQMPVMDGIQATKEIRRLEKLMGAIGPGTPQSDYGAERTPSEAASVSSSTTDTYRSSVIIVALTASSLQSDRVAALAAGCNDFLTKPVSLVWLNNKIIEWGSIKALQMWADLRPDAVKTITHGQAAQARSVASRLHVPEGRATPAGRSRESSLSRGQTTREVSTADERSAKGRSLSPLSDSDDPGMGKGTAESPPALALGDKPADGLLAGPLVSPPKLTSIVTKVSPPSLEEVPRPASHDLSAVPTLLQPYSTGSSTSAGLPTTPDLKLPGGYIATPDGEAPPDVPLPDGKSLPTTPQVEVPGAFEPKVVDYGEARADKTDGGAQSTDDVETSRPPPAVVVDASEARGGGD